MRNLALSRRFHTNAKTRWLILFAFLLCTVATLSYYRHLVYASWTLAVVPFLWHRNSSSFILSETHDAFDVTFANYSRDQLTAAPHDDLVPPILHHIALGARGKDWKEYWGDTVQSCLDRHPGWQSYIWTDQNAEAFVEKRFPEMLATWKGYQYPVERVDALRYMVLYEHGGVILDMDLMCRRSLGPLRRFSFVAPAAHPTGFSIGFMMATKHNPFVRSLVRNLKRYDVQWLGLPYATVMFSSGCHYASVIHTYDSNRGDLKILPGPLHSLNGRVSTPVFDHLGSSSWHSYDAYYITQIGKMSRLGLLSIFIVLLALVAVKRSKMLLHQLVHETP